MCTFLNRPAIVESILNLIEEAEKEIILIVPYIKLSETFYEALNSANKRGVEITIIYRELKLNNNERQKLFTLANLNLLAHSEVHSKCYLNENQMVITSMNLYDYSEKYNREMGILLDSISFENAFSDALEEVKSIIKSARIEKKSSNAELNGFNPSMLRPQYEKLILPCKLINKNFDNKYFEVIDDGESGQIICEGYNEFMDVFIYPDYSKEIDSLTGDFIIKRAVIEFLWDNDVMKKIHQAFNMKEAERKYNSFRLFWKTPQNSFSIYRNESMQPKWKELNTDQGIKKFKQGIDYITEDIKKIERRLR